MDVTDTGRIESAEDRAFRGEARSWLEDNLVGDFAALRGAGGPGREHEAYDGRLAWNRHLAASGWTCVGWPVEHGGRGLPLSQQVIFHEEYARANAPARVNHLGEELLGPTLIAFGTETQQRRFLPRIKAVEELWCQGYSEPQAGSDLAGVRTRAHLEPPVSDEPRGGGSGRQWVIDGQKIWTSLAHQADWCFLIARTEPPPRDGTASRHHGLSYLLVPMDQQGVEVRPIVQLTGTSEFNEVFFTGARTEEDMVVGEVGEGWRVAMATLGFERGVSTIGQQVGFRRELDAVVTLARTNGSYDDPVVRDRLARATVDLEVIGLNALRTLDREGTAEPVAGSASIAKLLWAHWHRTLGELAMLVRGVDGVMAGKDEDGLDEWQRLFLFSRADTIYGGSDEIQRNILAERVLGLPREVHGEPRGTR